MISNHCQVWSHSKLISQDGKSVIQPNQSFSLSCIGELSQLENLQHSDIVVHLIVEGRTEKETFWEVVGTLFLPLEERIGIVHSSKSEIDKPICLIS